MRRWLFFLIFIAFFSLACDLNRVIQIVPEEQTEIPAQANQPQANAPQPQAPQSPTATPVPTETPTPGPFLSDLSTDTKSDRALPRHGLIIAFLLPILLFGIPGLFVEVFVARYVQPRSIDLTGVLIKAQDGLFIDAIVSLTARKTLNLISLTARWPRIRDVVEKAVEQELIHEALSYSTLPELENGLKEIIQRFTTLDVIDELSRDFGIEALRFNVEIRYPPDTMDAINRTAEASAGGQAYVAYARAAHLDPDSAEARELYNVFQQTTSQVDAARNLGTGISGLANILGQARPAPRPIEEDDGSES